MRGAWMVAVAAVGCDVAYVAETGSPPGPATSTSPDPTGTHPGTGTDTDTDAPGPALDDGPPGLTGVTCALRGGDALFIDCTARTDLNAEVWIEVTERGDALSRASRATVGMNHALTAWALAAGATYDVEVVARSATDTERGASSSFTMPTPGIVDAYTPTLQTSGAWQLEHLVANLSCSDENSVVVLDDQGRIVWYADGSSYGRLVTALTFTDARTILAVYDDQRLLEWELDGTLVRDWDHADLGGYVHHEVHRVGDRLVGLSIEPMTLGGKNYAIDAIRVWGPDGAIERTWTVADILDPTDYGWYNVDGYWADELPGHYDPFHANALGMDEAGDLYLSFKDMGRVLKLKGGLDDPSFGDLIWTLHADGSGTVSLEYGGVAPAFLGQHHVTRHPDGSLWMFDNNGFPSYSRGLRLELDDAARTAVAVDEYPMTGVACPMTGSAFALDGGGAVVDCGSDPAIREFNATGQSVWDLQWSCGFGTVPTYRAIPVFDIDS